MPHPSNIDALAALVQRMVEESGAPTGFDAHRWLQEWMSRPVPAFGNRHPRDVLDDPSGFDLLQFTLLRMQTGAYS